MVRTEANLKVFTKCYSCLHKRRANWILMGCRSTFLHLSTYYERERQGL